MAKLLQISSDSGSLKVVPPKMQILGPCSFGFNACSTEVASLLIAAVGVFLLGWISAKSRCSAEAIASRTDVSFDTLVGGAFRCFRSCVSLRTFCFSPTSFADAAGVPPTVSYCFAERMLRAALLPSNPLCLEPFRSLMASAAACISAACSAGGCTSRGFGLSVTFFKGFLARGPIGGCFFFTACSVASGVSTVFSAARGRCGGAAASATSGFGARVVSICGGAVAGRLAGGAASSGASGFGARVASACGARGGLGFGRREAGGCEASSSGFGPRIVSLCGGSGMERVGAGVSSASTLDTAAAASPEGCAAKSTRGCVTGGASVEGTAGATGGDTSWVGGPVGLVASAVCIPAAASACEAKDSGTSALGFAAKGCSSAAFLSSLGGSTANPAGFHKASDWPTWAAGSLSFAGAGSTTFLTKAPSVAAAVAATFAKPSA
mmetsp:Transcript_53680/g.120560  ORF Transcript_53680/g.120560 Transcript_53680/m.120560 type:complete len:438 (+) Transcript_53680:754-2067(+)